MGKIEAVIQKINCNIIKKQEINRVIAVLKRGVLSRPSGGPEVKKFQMAMRGMLNQKYAFAVTSGTAALHLAISSLGLKTSDEVIIPALANIADLSVIIQEGAKPVFADIDPESFNIDPRDIEKKITDKTRAIIVVHMYGQPAKIGKIQQIAKRHKLCLIEDCAQAAGARYKGKYVGSFGDISCFSFYQTKHIIIGEGGMVLTKNLDIAKTIDSIANNGIKKDNIEAYNYDKIGYNYQMSELQAVLGSIQLKKLDGANRIRQKNARIYKDRLKEINLIFQKNERHTENAYFYLTGLLPDNLTADRNKFILEIRKRGAPIKNLYPLSLPEIALVKNKKNNERPIAKAITKRLFNLYVNPGLDSKDIINFSNIIKSVYYKLKNEKK